MAPLNILIVGCGIAGPLVATLLLTTDNPSPEKPHVTVLERSSSVRPKGQNVDIRGAGITIIRKLGLEPQIRAATTGEEGVQLVDQQNHIWAAFPADRTGRVRAATADIEILRDQLAQICWKRSKQISEQVQRDGGFGIEYVFGDYLDDLEQHGNQVDVRFAKSGQRRSFDVVVGADGLQSTTRKMVWGVESEEARIKRLDMYGAFFSMPADKTDSKWRRWFHVPGRGIMLRPSGQKGKTTVFMTVVNERDERLRHVAERTNSAGGGTKAQKKLLSEYFGNAGWQTKRILREMSTADDFYYDVVAQVKMDKWSKGQVVLLGDAGYCPSPISGMGTTLAIVGAYHLAGALTRFPSNLDSAFAEYERHMRPTVDAAQKLIPGAPYILNPTTEWGVWTLHMFTWLLYWTGLFNMLLKFIGGPPADLVTVEDYGLVQLPNSTEAIETS